MSSKRLDLSGVQQSSKQPVFEHGMISPPPLDDMFTSHMGVGQAECASLEMLVPNFQSIVANRQLPPTPDSINQVAGYVAEDLLEGIPSMHESPTQSPVRTERPEWSLEEQGNNKKQRRASINDSKDRSREKNKIAAAKCRQKKRNNTDLIENSHRALSAENSLLRRTEQQLRATVAELRTMALDHQNCSCGVHQFNMLEAKKLAHGMRGMRCPESSFMQARKLSDPLIKAESPGELCFHARAHSFAPPGSFDGPPEGFMSMPDGSLVEEQDIFDFDPMMVEASVSPS